MTQVAKVFEIAVKQALKFFQAGAKPAHIAKHAENVMKAAAKVAKNVK